MATEEEREFDLIVYGATGFTGKLVVEHLFKQQVGVKWGIAGRSLARLEEVLKTIPESLQYQKIGTIEANASRQDSLLQMARRTKVILSTVGPFMRYGTPLIEACIEAGTHYVDITGETPWVKGMIDRFHEEAVRKGVLIVPMCGFDSIPADIGAFLCVQEASKLQTQVTQVDAVVTTSGAPSGGTIASIMNLLENPASLRGTRNPYYLNPASFTAPLRRVAHDSDRIGLAYSREARMWTVPFLMAGVNTRVVRRSHALLLDRYGSEFSYNESQGVPSGLIVAFITLLFLGFAVFLLYFSLGRRLAQRFLPNPGEGPSAETRARSNFQYRFYGRTRGSALISVTISGGDPGYTETSKMVAESALCLVSRPRIPGRGGFLTPSSCFGMNLVERLQSVGIQFKIEHQ